MNVRNIISLVTSSLLCATSAIPVAANASDMMIDMNGSGRYELFLQYSETEIIYCGLDRDPDDLCRYVSPSFNEEIPDSYQPLDLFGLEITTESDKDILIEYLKYSYPELSYNKDTSSFQFPEDNWSMDKYMSLMKDIYENIGFCLNYGHLEINTSINLQPLGDLDGDNTVNALDASLVLTYYSNSQTGNTEIYSDEEIADISLLGDYDGDGAVNALDASLVLKEYAETQTA